MASLSPEALHALQMAIRSELDTVQIYKHLIKHAKDKHSEDLLRRLIEEEHDHEQKMKEKILAAGEEIPQADINIEVPNRQQLMELELENCSASELINLAIENERISHDFYEAQYKRANNEEVKSIFKWLVEQEKQHILNLKKEYANYQK